MPPLPKKSHKRLARIVPYKQYMLPACIPICAVSNLAAPGLPRNQKSSSNRFSVPSQALAGGQSLNSTTEKCPHTLTQPDFSPRTRLAGPSFPFNTTAYWYVNYRPQRVTTHRASGRQTATASKPQLALFAVDAVHEPRPPDKGSSMPPCSTLVEPSGSSNSVAPARACTRLCQTTSTRSILQL